MITYLQSNKYIHSTNKDGLEEFLCQRIIRIIPLKQKGEKKIYYDKELNIHFESPESYYSYEIEVQDVHLQVAKRYRKAQDFLRRLNYKYDWIHLERCSSGKTISVSNLDEIRKSWVKLKERILKDYKGKAVNTYLEKISVDFEKDNHFNDIFSQYYEYALLYPPIPEFHGTEWKKQRLIKLDNTPQTELIEMITFEGNNENIRKYTLNWKKHDSDSIIHISEAKGTLEYCTLSHSVKEAIVNITFAYDESVTNQWEFRLKKMAT